MPSPYRGKTLAGEAVAIRVEDEVISEVTPIADAADLPLIGPPLVDLQQNGALGRRFNLLASDPSMLPVIAGFVRRHGVGRMLATFTTHPYEQQLASLREFDRQLTADAGLARLYFGAFFEGIYMSPEEGWRGAHDPQWMRPPSWDEWAALQEAAGGRIRIFNIAPELPGAIAIIRHATRHGLRVAMGHCGPDANTIRRAVEAGADLVTHFGNGAPALVPRHDNPFWTWLALPEVKLGVIADGFHLPEDVLRTVFAVKGRDHVYPVSDASSHSGMPRGDYENFTIGADHVCRLKDSPLLAGAWFQADRNVERLCELGWTLAEAWRQQSVVPASIIGLDLPRLEAGQPAEFVLASWSADTGLSLSQVVVMGRELLAASVHPRTR